MRCKSCNCNLTDKEATRKYLDHENIANPEDKYIDLCNYCLRDSELEVYIEDFKQSDELPSETEFNIYEGDCV